MTPTPTEILADELERLYELDERGRYRKLRDGEIVEAIDDKLPTILTALRSQRDLIEDAVRIAESFYLPEVLNDRDSARNATAKLIADRLRALSTSTPSPKPNEAGMEELSKAISAARDRLSEAMAVCAGCATIHGDPGGGLEETHQLICDADVGLGFALAATALATPTSGNTQSPGGAGADDLRKALRQGAAWFAEYADQHQAEANALGEGVAPLRLDREIKAARNRERAAFLAQAASMPPPAGNELDKASEAFADRVAWEDEDEA